MKLRENEKKHECNATDIRIVGTDEESQELRCCAVKINSTFTRERNGKEHPKNGMRRTMKANVWLCGRSERMKRTSRKK